MNDFDFIPQNNERTEPDMNVVGLFLKAIMKKGHYETYPMDTIIDRLTDEGKFVKCSYFSSEYKKYNFVRVLPCEVKEDEENYGCLITTYFVTLKDIVSGLTKAANGTFNTRPDVSAEYSDRNIEFAKRSFNAFAFDEREWDYNTADCLMQIILFNEIVYG